MNDSKTTRRDLLRALGMGTGLALIAPLAMRGGSVARAAGARGMGMPAGLELDGVFIPLDSVDGGNAFADVAVDPAIDAVQRKHLSLLRYEDITLGVPFGAAPALMAWIGTWLSKGPQQKSGAIVYVDVNFKDTKRLEFLNAVISEVSLPACNAGVPARGESLIVRLTPQETRLTGGTGRTMNMSLARTTTVVSPANFRMNVQGLESSCTRIRTVSAPVGKRTTAGQLPKSEAVREKPLPAGLLDCSTVTVTLPENDAGPFYQWFNDFALRGNTNQERAGRLEYLSPDRTRVIAAVDFGNLGITRYAPLPPSDAQGGGIAAVSTTLVQVDMFCETMNLTVA